MEENKLDTVLQDLSIAQPAIGLNEGFRDAMWQRVGELTEARDRRRRAILGAAIFAVSLGTGLGATITPAMAEPTRYGMYDGSELAPSSLLHLS